MLLGKRSRAAAGNVGIGTNTPLFKLDIQNGGLNALRVKGKSNFVNNDNDNEYINVFSDGANGYIDYHGSQSNASLLLNTQNNKQVKIGSGGLEVNGVIRSLSKIHCTELLVCADGWCDYVFDEKYNLTPLLDVEKFIKENKHLPDVPSAASIENSEVNIYEMQKVQMRKIEELTLYLIELKKENEALKLLIEKK